MTILLLCCSLLSLPSVARVPYLRDNAAAKHSISARNLSEDFMKSSLRVLKMIETETGQMSRGQDGGTLVPRATNQALDDLEAEAQTEDNHAVVGVLKDLFEAKVRDNLIISTISMMTNTALTAAHLPRGPLQVSELTAKSPTVVKMHINETACSSQLETTLRGRIYSAVAACDARTLIAETPDELDVPVHPAMRGN